MISRPRGALGRSADLQTLDPGRQKTSSTVASPELVSVVIPAYNAAATLDETLHSVRAQTHTNLEILVVDDGSTDETAQIVTRHAADDRRVRLLRQDNGGVARARNHGVREAQAEFIAPLDADDLWRADKIAKQMQAMRRGGDKIGLVYTWFALIDENSVILDASPPERAEGDVLRTIYSNNIVGNGSSPLMRKTAVLAVGGYDPKLRDNDAQGCEDHLIYARIAEENHFAVVPEFLTGYRQTGTNMSSDTLRMLRSWTMIAEDLGTRRPNLAAELKIAECSILYWLYTRSVRAFQPKRAWRVMAFMTDKHPGMALKFILRTPYDAILGLMQARARRRSAKARRYGLKFLDTPIS